jgi:hypothetical protein
MRTIALLLVFIISGSCDLIAQKNTDKIPCPPTDKVELAGQFSPVGVNANLYKLQFIPTDKFKNRLQSYTNYLYSLYPKLQSFSQEWKVFDGGVGTLPIQTNNIVQRNDGTGLTDCITDFHPGYAGEMTMDPFAGPFPQPFQYNRWYTIKVMYYTNESGVSLSRIPPGCETMSISINVKINNGVTRVSIGDEKKIIKEFNILQERCMDFNDRSPHTLSNWKHNGHVESITYEAEPGGHEFYLRFVDGDKESIAFNTADYNGNWLTKYENQCVCFDYRIKYDPFVEPQNSYAPYICIYTGNRNLEGSGNAWNKGLVYAKFVSNNSHVNNLWRHYCLPVSLCTKSLPSNEFGHWEINSPDSCAAWNTIIQNVTGMIIPTDYNRAPSEVISFDNFCSKNCNDAGSEAIPSYPIGCPPMDKSELAKLFSTSGTGSGPFQVKYSPAADLINKQQAYVNYISFLYPGLKAVSQSVQFYDGGTGVSPSPGKIVDGNNYHSEIKPNDGITLITDPAPVVLPEPLQSGRWYIIKVSFNTEGMGALKIPAECSAISLSYRVQMVKGVRKVTLK